MAVRPPSRVQGIENETAQRARFEPEDVVQDHELVGQRIVEHAGVVGIDGDRQAALPIPPHRMVGDSSNYAGRKVGKRAEFERHAAFVKQIEDARILIGAGRVAHPIDTKNFADKVKGFIPVPLGPLGASQWPRSVWLEG